MKKLLALLITCFTISAQAAPFILSDPYPTTVTQPDTCTWTSSTGAVFKSPVGVNADGSKYCHIDLATLPRGQSYSGSVTADSSAWGSSTPVPFGFNASPPNAGTGLRLGNN